MDIVKDLLEKHGGEWINQLVQSTGFDAAQAQRFVPAAIQAVSGVLQGGKLDLASLLSGGASALTQEVDTAAVAAEAGVPTGLAETGLQALAPQILDTLKANAGGLDGLLGALGGGGGDVAAKAGGLFGAAKKLFGR